MDVKNISEVSVEEVTAFLESFDTVLLDCDGVLWHIHDILPGVIECLAILKARGKKIKFVSNNSVRPDNDYIEMFKHLDIELNVNDLIHPVNSIINYLKRINFEGLIYCIATKNFKKILQSAGFNLIDDPMELIPESFSQSVRLICNKQPVKAVIVDTDFNASHPKLARAAYFLSDPTVHFITGASDLHLPIAKNLTILGPGYFHQVIEKHTKRKSINLAKPSKDLAEIVVAANGQRCLFIGDMIEQDMGFANNCGFKKLLVLSGGTSKTDLNNLPTESNLKPDYYGNSLSDLYLAIKKIDGTLLVG